MSEIIDKKTKTVIILARWTKNHLSANQTLILLVDLYRDEITQRDQQRRPSRQALPLRR